MVSWIKKNRENRYREMAEALTLYVRKLNDESREGALIVVEGKRDLEALRSIGFHGEAVMLCHNNLKRLVEEAEAHRKIILLFDLDKEGRSLTKKAALLLQERRVGVDLYFRRELLHATKGRIRYIEELIRFRDYIQPRLQLG